MRVRLPAVAGSFYDARPDRLEREVRERLSAAASTQPTAPAFGAMVPHAGYVYSGPVAAAVYARLRIPRACVILCPNHTGRGA
ncbi:MAG: AmmeMemoRadiSam system protein B, partial [Thermoanaerobaculia bacterium]